jgi:nitrite reductase/ring-hydroxylating ferredoxin subunit
MPVEDLPLLPSGTRLCAVSDVADGTARVVELGRGWPIVEVIVLRRGDRWIGYHNRCPHQPVPLNLLANVFVVGDALVCDHHSARFNVEDGYCTTGPCKGDSLASVALAVREETIVVA